MRKTILLTLLFASPVFAQETASVVTAGGGCGPAAAQFDVKADQNHHPVGQPEPGKALVYVFEDIERGPTLKVGLDGAWVGANKGKSYFFFSVNPGDHQLCTGWQSGVFKKTAMRIGAAVTVQAEAGKVYYLRIQLNQRTKDDVNVVMMPVEGAEGQFLISACGFSTFLGKK